MTSEESLSFSGKGRGKSGGLIPRDYAEHEELMSALGYVEGNMQQAKLL